MKHEVAIKGKNAILKFENGAVYQIEIVTQYDDDYGKFRTTAGATMIRGNKRCGMPNQKTGEYGFVLVDGKPVAAGIASLEEIEAAKFITDNFDKLTLEHLETDTRNMPSY